MNEAMEVVYCICLCLIVLVISLILLKRVLDCDLNLLWHQRFGKSPDTLSGKVVWIWGASCGLGEALAYELAKRGCKLILSASSLRMRKLYDTRAICLSYGNLQVEDVIVLSTDMLAGTSYVTEIKDVINRFIKIDIVVNDLQGLNLLSRRKSLSRQNINFFEPVCLTKAVLPYMPSDGRFVVAANVSDKISMAKDGLCLHTLWKRDMNVVFENLEYANRPASIPVTVICSQILSRSAAVGMRNRGRQVSSERIASLAAVAVANSLFEVWILPTPKIFLCYLFHYLPNVARKIERKINGCNSKRKHSKAFDEATNIQCDAK